MRSLKLPVLVCVVGEIESDEVVLGAGPLRELWRFERQELDCAEIPCRRGGYCSRNL